MKPKSSPFRSAKEELPHVKATPKTSKQAISPSYKLAFNDQAFLLRNELRPVRLQLELLKAELLQQDQGIDSTVVVFGSARTKDKKEAEINLSNAKKALKKDPENQLLQKNVSIAERLYEKSHYYEQARKLAKIISSACQPSKRCHFVIVTGGGPGIMEAANRGAHDIGAKSIGLNIVLPNEQGPNTYSTPELTFQFHYFAIRKMHFLIRARAMVFFPGGFGSLDELFETLTLMQTGKIQKLPTILVGKAFWEKLINFQFMLDEGVIDEQDLGLFQYAETAEEVWDIIGKFYTS
jgi:uncharacterized protein (TIGR00730 family)